MATMIMVAIAVVGGCGTDGADEKSATDTQAETVVADPTEAPTAAPTPTTAPAPTEVPEAVPTEVPEVEPTETAPATAEAAEFDEAQMMLGMLAAFGLELNADEEACFTDAYADVPPGDPDDEMAELVGSCVEGDFGYRVADNLVETAMTDDQGFNADERDCMKTGVGEVMTDGLLSDAMTDAESDFGFERAAALCGVLGRVSALDGIVTDDAAPCIDAEALASPPQELPPAGESALTPYLDACGAS